MFSQNRQPPSITTSPARAPAPAPAPPSPPLRRALGGRELCDGGGRGRGADGGGNVGSEGSYARGTSPA